MQLYARQLYTITANKYGSVIFNLYKEYVSKLKGHYLYS